MGPWTVYPKSPAYRIAFNVAVERKQRRRYHSRPFLRAVGGQSRTDGRVMLGRSAHCVDNSRELGLRAARRTLLAFILLGVMGCQMFRQQGPVPKQVAQARQLSQQGLTAMERGDLHSAETLLGEAVKA